MKLTSLRLEELGFIQIETEVPNNSTIIFELVCKHTPLTIIKEDDKYRVILATSEEVCDLYFDPFADFDHFEYVVKTVADIFDMIAQEKFQEGQDHKINELKKVLSL